MDFLYKGVVDLANNENLNLTLEEVNKIWESKYYKSIYNFKDDCINFLKIMHEVFDKAIELYAENIESEQENEYTILDKIRLELTKCKLSISEIDTEFENMMIWKNE